jgi:hypothetical protein
MADEITARDLFAAAALAGIMANPKTGEELTEDGTPTVWQWAFQLADAMVAQRKKPKAKLDADGWVKGGE